MTKKKITGKPQSRHVNCPYCGKGFTARKKLTDSLNKELGKQGKGYLVRGEIYGNNKVKCVDCGKTINFSRTGYYKKTKGHKNLL